MAWTRIKAGEYVNKDGHRAYCYNTGWNAEWGVQKNGQVGSGGFRSLKEAKDFVEKHFSTEEVK